MEIIRLESGSRAPEAADRVHINCLPSGKYGWTGSIALRDAAVHGSGENKHDSRDDAEMEALAWAESYDPTELYIESDDA